MWNALHTSIIEGSVFICCANLLASALLYSTGSTGRPPFHLYQRQYTVLAEYSVGSAFRRSVDAINQAMNLFHGVKASHQAQYMAPTIGLDD